MKLRIIICLTVAGLILASNGIMGQNVGFGDVDDTSNIASKRVGLINSIRA